MLGKPRTLFLFPNSFNKFNNTRAPMYRVIFSNKEPDLFLICLSLHAYNLKFDNNRPLTRCVLSVINNSSKKRIDFKNQGLKYINKYLFNLSP